MLSSLIFFNQNKKGEKCIMYKRTIKYTDFNDVERTQDYYFYLSKTDLTKLNSRVEGGIQNKFEKMINKLDVKELVATVEELILSSYGEKSDDGTRFIKSKELAVAFSQTNAYDELFMSLINDPDSLADFIKKILPQDIQVKIDEEMAKGNIPNIVPENKPEIVDIAPKQE